MNQPHFILLPGKSPGPFSRILAVITGAAVLAVSFFFGLFILASVIGLVILAVIFIQARLWWMKRKIKQSIDDDVKQNRPKAQTGVIDGEFKRSQDDWQDS